MVRLVPSTIQYLIANRPVLEPLRPFFDDIEPSGRSSERLRYRYSTVQVRVQYCSSLFVDDLREDDIWHKAALVLSLVLGSGRSQKRRGGGGKTCLFDFIKIICLVVPRST